MLVQLGDVHLSVEAAGTSDPALIFVHGVGGDPRMWRAQIECFSRRYRVLVPALRGHGRSEHKPPYTSSRHAQDLLELCAHQSVERCVVVGSSMGAGVAFEMAAARPELVAGVMSVGGQATVGENQDRIRQLIDDVDRGDLELIAKEISKRVFSEKTNRELPALAAFHELVVLASGPATTRELWKAMLTYDVTRQARRVRCPTAIVFGDDDRLLPHSFQRELQALIPHASFHAIAGAGHIPPVETPQVFNSVLSQLLARL